MKTGLLVPAIVLLAACQPSAQDVTAAKAWVRLAAVPANPSAAYFDLKGGARDETLIGVATGSATRAEMHESMKGEAGMMTMAPLASVRVPADTDVVFAPGGKHVMLFGLKPVKPGDTIPLSLSFASGRTVVTQAKVVGPGDEAPAQ